MKKNVLVIDESPLLREYLKTKLLDNKGDVDVDTAANSNEAAAKIRLESPELILLGYPLGDTYMQVLQEKKLNPNTVRTPVILMAQQIDQEKIIELLPFGVKKVFTKPFKADTLFKTVTELLRVKYTIDITPGIMDIHVNGDILFIELAQGLNNDKLDILYYKVRELLALYEMNVPRIIIMLSDLKLTGDNTVIISGSPGAEKLEKLLRLLQKASKAKRRILQILTTDSHIRKFVGERGEYAEYRIVSTLQEAMELLCAGEKSTPEKAAAKTAPAKAKTAAPPDETKADGTATDGTTADGTAAEESEADGDVDAEVPEDVADLVESTGTILDADEPKAEDALLLRFDKDGHKQLTTESLRAAIRNLRIGVVDDDSIILDLIRNIFEAAGASVKTYSSGAEFLQEPEKALFDLVFMDLIMPEIDGFTVLQQLQTIRYETPVIILSSMNKQELVIKAFQMGVKSYLFKPINPEEIFKKTLEVLKSNF